MSFTAIQQACGILSSVPSAQPSDSHAFQPQKYSAHILRRVLHHCLLPSEDPLLDSEIRCSEYCSDFDGMLYLCILWQSWCKLCSRNSRTERDLNCLGYTLALGHNALNFKMLKSCPDFAAQPNTLISHNLVKGMSAKRWFCQKFVLLQS